MAAKVSAIYVVVDSVPLCRIQSLRSTAAGIAAFKQYLSGFVNSKITSAHCFKLNMHAKKNNRPALLPYYSILVRNFKNFFGLHFKMIRWSFWINYTKLSKLIRFDSILCQRPLR